MGDQARGCPGRVREEDGKQAAEVCREMRLSLMIQHPLGPPGSNEPWVWLHGTSEPNDRDFVSDAPGLSRGGAVCHARGLMPARPLSPNAPQDPRQASVRLLPCGKWAALKRLPDEEGIPETEPDMTFVRLACSPDGHPHPNGQPCPPPLASGFPASCLCSARDAKKPGPNLSTLVISTTLARCDPHPLSQRERDRNS